MLQLTKTPIPDNFSPTELEAKSDHELDGLPFGVIALDRAGVVHRYNLYESRFARIDRQQVLGRTFFGEIAPCARVDAFEGRFRRFTEQAEPRTMASRSTRLARRALSSGVSAAIRITLAAYRRGKNAWRTR
jgi:photoactive yellow protein